MATVLATLRFRETFPGMGCLLQAVNILLDCGEYKIRQCLNPAHPKHLYLEVYGKKASHCTLQLDLPLEQSTNELTLNELHKKFNSSQSAIRLMSTDDTVIFTMSSALYPTASPEDIQVADFSKIVHEHNFVLRKPAPHLGHLLHRLSVMGNKHPYKLICSSDPQTHRWLHINLFYSNYLHPIVICSRRLKAPKKDDLVVLSKINMASSHGAPILFTYDETEASIIASICEPASQNQLHHMLLALQLL